MCESDSQINCTLIFLFFFLYYISSCHFGIFLIKQRHLFISFFFFFFFGKILSSHFTVGNQYLCKPSVFFSLLKYRSKIKTTTQHHSQQSNKENSSNCNNNWSSPFPLHMWGGGIGSPLHPQPTRPLGLGFDIAFVTANLVQQ